jgi:hypothetical protein
MGLFFSSLLDSYPLSNFDATYGVYTGRVAVGQSFKGNGDYLDRVTFYISKIGSPTGDIYAHVYAHTGTFGSGGKGTGDPLAISDPVDIADMGTDFINLQNFSFSGDNNIILDKNVPYFVTFVHDGGNSTNRINLAIDSTSATHEGNMAVLSATTSGSWSNPSSNWDAIFYIYTKESINGIAPYFGGFYFGQPYIVPLGGKTFDISLVDVVNLEDTTSRLYLGARQNTETIIVTDPLVRSLLTDRSLAENITITDSSEKTFVMVIKLSDGLSVTDITQRQHTAQRQTESTIGIIDDITQSLIFNRDLASSLGITDTLTAERILLVELKDGVTLEDVVSYFYHQGGKSFVKIASVGRDTISSLGVGKDKPTGTTRIETDKPIVYDIKEE